MEHNTQDMNLSVRPSPQGLMRILISLVLVALMIYLGAAAKNALHDSDSIDQNVITVSANAREFAKPDTAVASFTVTKENASLETARTQVDTISNGVVEYLKQAGIDEKDIKTTSYSMYPRDEYDTPPCPINSICPPRKTGKIYVVEETFEVRIRNLDKVGDIISGVSGKGVNQIGALRFEVDDAHLKELSDTARQAAIAKARQDAEKLAGSLGVRLGKLKNFSESSGGQPMPYYAYGKGGADATMSAPAPQIATGQNEIVSNVTLIYEIR